MPSELKSAQHTAGPWQVFDDGAPTVAYVRLPGTMFGEKEIAVCYGKNPAANAHLIAAAPELLEVLAELSDAAAIYTQSHQFDMPCDCTLCSAIQQADAAIRKAKGE